MWPVASQEAAEVIFWISVNAKSVFICSINSSGHFPVLHNKAAEMKIVSQVEQLITSSESREDFLFC